MTIGIGSRCPLTGADMDDLESAVEPAVIEAWKQTIPYVRESDAVM